MSSAELTAKLSAVGLRQYEKVLIENGFETWNSVLDIRNTDLDVLQFKLCHRQSLQREIVKCRKQEALRNGTSNPETRSKTCARQKSVAENKQLKGRYRLYPKQDEDAPRRPKTGYFLFCDHLRTSPQISSMPFVEFSKYAGKLWRELGPDVRCEWKDKAAVALATYHDQEKEYKKTRKYKEYAQYIKAFHGQQRDKKTMKSSKPDTASTKLDADLADSSDAATSTCGSSRDDFLRFSSPLEQRLLEYSDQTPSLDQALKVVAAFIEAGPLYTEVFDETNLPPQTVVTQAVASFYSGTGTLLFLYTKEDILTTIDHVWNKDGDRVDRYALMDVFAIAALGSYYDSDDIKEETRESFFHSFVRLLLDIRGETQLHYMRLLLCLSIYIGIEKPELARLIISAAFQIGRSSLITVFKATNLPDGTVYWRNIFRTAVLIECTFSFLLGYPSSVQESDIMFACVWSGATESVEEVLQDQSSKIWALAAEIWRKLPSPPLAETHLVLTFAEKLDCWHNELPMVMRLSTLTSTESTILSALQRRSILLLHMFYLSTVTHLHKRVLGIAEEELESWNTGIRKDEIEKFREYCIIASHQASRIASLLDSDLTTRKKWAAILPTFEVCSALLFSAARMLLQHSYDEVEVDLSYVKSCMVLLTRCVDADTVVKYLRVAQAIHDALITIKSQSRPQRVIRQLTVSGSPSQQGEQCAGKTSQRYLLSSVTYEARGLLLNPYRVINE